MYRRILFLSFFLFGMLLSTSLGYAQTVPTPTSYPPLPDACLNQEEANFLGLINDYRKQNNLPALIASKKVSAAAFYHSQDMADDNYFKHDLNDPDPKNDGTIVTWSENMRLYGYTANTNRGENIGAVSERATDMFFQWKNSTGHNSNMLNSTFKVIGIGRGYNANSSFKYYWTTDFGGYVYSNDAAEYCAGVTPGPTSVQPTTITTPTATPTPATLTQAAYVTLPSGVSNVKDAKRTVFQARTKTTLKQIACYGCGTGSSIVVNNSNSTFTIGTKIFSGLTSSVSSSWGILNVNIPLTASSYYVIQFTPITTPVSYGSTVASYADFSFMRYATAGAPTWKTGSWQIRLMYTK